MKDMECGKLPTTTTMDFMDIKLETSEEDYQQTAEKRDSQAELRSFASSLPQSILDLQKNFELLMAGIPIIKRKERVNTESWNAFFREWEAVCRKSEQVMASCFGNVLTMCKLVEKMSQEPEVLPIEPGTVAPQCTNGVLQGVNVICIICKRPCKANVFRRHLSEIHGIQTLTRPSAKIPARVKYGTSASAKMTQSRKRPSSALPLSVQARPSSSIPMLLQARSSAKALLLAQSQSSTKASVLATSKSSAEALLLTQSQSSAKASVLAKSKSSAKAPLLAPLQSSATTPLLAPPQSSATAPLLAPSQFCDAPSFLAQLGLVRTLRSTDLNSTNVSAGSDIAVSARSDIAVSARSDIAVSARSDIADNKTGNSPVEIPVKKEIRRQKARSKKTKKCKWPKKFSCETCGSQFLYRCKLETHMVRRHGYVPDGIFRIGCSFCTAVFLTREEHRQHQYENHNPRKSKNPAAKPLKRLEKVPQPYSCEFCSMRYSTAKSLRRHVRIKHHQS